MKTKQVESSNSRFNLYIAYLILCTIAVFGASFFAFDCKDVSCVFGQNDAPYEVIRSDDVAGSPTALENIYQSEITKSNTEDLNATLEDEIEEKMDEQIENDYIVPFSIDDIRQAARKQSSSIISSMNSPQCKEERVFEYGKAEEGLVGAYGKAKCMPMIADWEIGDAVWISQSLKLIYVPNMKAASSSITYYLRKFGNATRVGTHLLGNIGKDFRVKDYFVFTFVRDPVDAFFSSYAEINRRLAQQNPAKTFSAFSGQPVAMESEPGRAMDMLKYISHHNWTGPKSSSSYFSRVFSHMYSQVWKTQRCVGYREDIRSSWKDSTSPYHQVAREAAEVFQSNPTQDCYEDSPEEVHQLFDFDFVGRVENLQKDFAYLTNLLHLPRHRLPTIQSFHHTKYARHSKLLKETENQELLKQVCEYYAKDFACFGYDLPTACK